MALFDVLQKVTLGMLNSVRRVFRTRLLAIVVIPSQLLL